MAKKNKASTLLYLLLAGGIGYYVAKYSQAPEAGKNVSEKQCALRTTMRKLWSDHVFWTRDYIIAALAESSEMTPIVDRLEKNQRDIGNAIIPYYGKEAGQKLRALLTEHINIAIEIIAAAKSYNFDKLRESDEKWHRNAASIADFFHNIHGSWSKDAMVRMFNAHLTLTTEELDAHLKKEWKVDITTFDKVYEQALDMADHLTAGIVAQFPQKF